MLEAFALNPAGIVELLKSESLAADMRRRVATVEERAKSTAPVVSGDYRDSITSGTFDDGDRTSGYVQADVAYACEVEVRHRTLGAALGDAGGA
jgi:hypothetical protein